MGDLTAFFEENCKSEILSEKASAKSGLFGYEMTTNSSSSSNNSKQDNNTFGKHKQQNTSSSELNHLHSTVNHNRLPNGNGNSNNGTANYIHNHDYEGLQGTSQYDSEQTTTANSYGGMVDSLRIEAMEKNVSLLNREVK